MTSRQNVHIVAVFVVIVLLMIAVGVYLSLPVKEVDRSAENNSAGIDAPENDKSAEIPSSCSSLGQLIKESTQPGPIKADLNLSD